MELRDKNVILVALVSARDKGAADALADLESSLTSAGGVVVGRIVQRRGVSRDKRPGGADRMEQPLSAATFIGKGKAEELASLCKEVAADLVLFKNPLSPAQQANLSRMCGIPVEDARILDLRV